MVQDTIGSLAILLVALLSAVVLALLVGFTDSGDSGKRAFLPLLLLCLLMGSLQIFRAQFAPWLVGLFLLLEGAVFAWRRRNRAR